MTHTATNAMRKLLFILCAAMTALFSSAQVATSVASNGASAGSPASSGPGSGTVTDVSGGVTQTAIVNVANGTTTPVVTADVIPQTPTGNALLDGGRLGYSGTGLSFVVSAASYIIQGDPKTSLITTLTAAAADPTNPRTDVVYLDSSGVAGIITGTPSNPAVKPQVDPTTQLELTSYDLAAGATNLPVTVTNVYINNAEWTMTKSGAPINLASTNNPYSATLDIEATAAVAGNSFTATAPSSFVATTSYDSLVFFIRNKASWSSAKQLSIQFYLAGVPKGSIVTFKGNTFGFNSQSLFSAYQQIVIPISTFGVNGLTVDQLKFTVAGGGGSIGWYIDNITLQNGLLAQSPGTGTVTNITGAMTPNQLVIGNGGSDIKPLGSLGTSTQVYHGNASGAGTFSQVGLTTDVTGILPVANGGTGTATPGLVAGTNISSITGTWPNQTINASGGSGTVTTTGSPSSGQAAEFSGATSITGVATTGSGSYVKATSPTLVTPTLGAATATTINGNTITTGSSTYTGMAGQTYTFPTTTSTLFGTTTTAHTLQNAQLVTLSSSGTDTFVGTAGVAATGYNTGDVYIFTANTANTGAASININSQGAMTIVKVVGGIATTLADNDIRSGQVCEIAYDGTNFQLQSTLGNAASGSPAGSNTQIQYNNSGAFGASSGLTYGSNTVTVTNASADSHLYLTGAASAFPNIGVGDLAFNNSAVASGTTNLASVQGLTGSSKDVGRLRFYVKKAASDSNTTVVGSFDENAVFNLPTGGAMTIGTGSAVFGADPGGLSFVISNASTDTGLGISGSSTSTGLGLADISFRNLASTTGTKDLAQLQMSATSSKDQGKLNISVKEGASDSSPTTRISIDDNLWLKPKGSGYVHIGASAGVNSAFTIPASVQYPLGRTSGSAINAFFIGSNDASNPFGLVFNITGAADVSSATRIVNLNVTQIGSNSNGRLLLTATSIEPVGNFIPSQTNGIVGTTTNNNANAGSVGETVTSVVASGSAVSLTTNTGANVTSISLTAGDWDVDGNVNFSAASATVTGTSGGVTSTSATVPTDGTEVYSGVQVTLLSETDSVTLPTKRFSLSGTTTVYLVGKCTFSAGTVSAFGSIVARRRR